jgi:hypothetical protein
VRLGGATVSESQVKAEILSKVIISKLDVVSAKAFLSQQTGKGIIETYQLEGPFARSIGFEGSNGIIDRPSMDVPRQIEQAARYLRCELASHRQ